MDIKTLTGAIAVLLTFAAYIPYFRDLIKNKIQPHVYSWFLWTVMTGITYALQVSDQAGPSAYVTLAATVLCVGVLGISLAKNYKKDIVFSDTVFLILSFVSLALWLVAKQPLLSAVLINITQVLAFIPTIRKTWQKPYSETLSFYTLSTIRFAFATAALDRYTFITALYPVIWFFANGLFFSMMIIRRKAVSTGTART